MKCNFETDTNVDECLSGTISDGDKQTTDCLEVIQAINDTSIYNQDETRKERQLKLALSFDQTILPHFYEATRDPIVRAGGYHMLMEFLFSFENELVRCGSFFAGSEPGFLDLWIYPWIGRVGIWTPDFTKGEMVCTYFKFFLIFNWSNLVSSPELAKKNESLGLSDEWRPKVIPLGYATLC